MLRAQVALVAELHSLWADLGTVSENVEHADRFTDVGDTLAKIVDAAQSDVST